MNIEKNVTSTLTKTKDSMASALESFTDELLTQAKQEIIKQVQEQFFNINLEQIAKSIVEEKLKELLVTFSFPDESIKANAIDWTDSSLTGDLINGGTITNFKSTGIHDIADSIQLTVMNDMVVIEGSLVTRNAVIKDSLTVEGHVKFNGDVTLPKSTFDPITKEVTSSVNQTFEEHLSNAVPQAIIETIANGINTSDLKISGFSILTELKDDSGQFALGNQITKSQLTRLGTLSELTVSGNANINETLIIKKNRIGINTTEPGMALDIWDQETNVIIGKYMEKTATVNTNSMTDLILGTNNKQQILLSTDGSVKVKNITINNITVSTARTMPNDPGNPGDIRINEAPSIGNPWGWICLGGARWAVAGVAEG